MTCCRHISKAVQRKLEILTGQQLTVSQILFAKYPKWYEAIRLLPTNSSDCMVRFNLTDKFEKNERYVMSIYLHKIACILKTRPFDF